MDRLHLGAPGALVEFDANSREEFACLLFGAGPCRLDGLDAHLVPAATRDGDVADPVRHLQLTTAADLERVAQSLGLFDPVVALRRAHPLAFDLALLLDDDAGRGLRAARAARCGLAGGVCAAAGIAIPATASRALSVCRIMTLYFVFLRSLSRYDFFARSTSCAAPAEFPLRISFINAIVL